MKPSTRDLITIILYLFASPSKTSEESLELVPPSDTSDADRVKIPHQFAGNVNRRAIETKRQPNQELATKSFNLPIVECQHFNINYINITSRFRWARSSQQPPQLFMIRQTATGTIQNNYPKHPSHLPPGSQFPVEWRTENQYIPFLLISRILPFPSFGCLRGIHRLDCLAHWI